MTTIQLALIIVSQILAALNVAVLIYIGYKAYRIGESFIPFAKSTIKSGFTFGADATMAAAKSLAEDMDFIDGLKAFLEARLVYEVDNIAPSLRNFENIKGMMQSILYEINCLEIVAEEGKFYLVDSTTRTNGIEFKNPIIHFEEKKSFTDSAFDKKKPMNN